MSTNTLENPTENILAVEIPWPLSESGVELSESEISTIKLLELTIDDLNSKLSGLGALEQERNDLQAKVDRTPEIIQQTVAKALGDKAQLNDEVENYKSKNFELEAMNRSYLTQIGEYGVEKQALSEKVENLTGEVSDLEIQIQTLSALGKPQEEELAAVKKELEETKNNLERLQGSTEVFRTQRNAAEAEASRVSGELEQLQTKYDELKRSNSELENAHRIAKAELEGVPKLIENKVKVALAGKTEADPEALNEALAKVKSLTHELAVMSERQQKTAATNAKLDQEVKGNAKDLEEGRSHIEMLTELVETQRAQIAHTDEGLRNADRNYHLVMHHLDELMGFTSIICAENHELRNDNLYLGQAVEFHDMKVVWKGGSWQAFMLAKSNSIRPQDGQPMPHLDFGLMYLMDLNTGRGHTAYIGEDGKPYLSDLVDPQYALPEQYWDEFTEAVKAVPVKKMELALYRATERAKKVIHYANHFDIEWCTQVSYVEIAQRLYEYIPEHELTRALANIEKAKLLAPKSQALLNRINKRFDTDYKMRSKGGRVPDKPQPKANSRKRGKKSKRK